MTGSLKNWQGITAIVGVDWGDSGKGRLVDDLSQRADIIARYSGGANTGHSIKNSFGEFSFHIMPSGIFNGKAKALVGRNVAVDLEVLLQEMESLDKAKVSYKNLVIDEQAHLTMPWHKDRDGLREIARSVKVGTTGRGVGPTYADKTERAGIRVIDLFKKDFKLVLKEEVVFQNKFFKLSQNSQKIYKKYSNLSRRIDKYVGKTIPLVKKAIELKKNILFEGAQGYFLDIDSGTYPFVTSSHPGIVGIWTCFDLHPNNINHAVGITKAYLTRVGNGPMPTKINGKESKIIVEIGREFGTTTGRRRDPGWLDLVLLQEAVKVNNLNYLAITKLDVLTGIKKIKICTGYKMHGKTVDYLGHDAQYLEKCQPIYEEMPGWSENLREIRNFRNLPKNAQSYIKKIQNFVKIPVKFISVGPKRGEVIYV